MLTVAAAMRDEIRIVLDLCTGPRRLPIRGVAAWQATCNGIPVHLLRTGMGTSRAEGQLGRYLAVHRPSGILIAGFCGALDPGLRLGDLVVIRRVSLLGTNCKDGTPLEKMEIEGSWALDGAEDLVRTAESAGLRASSADAVTTPFIVGDPVQKKALHARLGAAIIDMESAAIAAAATRAGIPLLCVRAVSDEADDDFLAPFAYAPGCGPAGRAVKVAAAGGWVRRYRSWRECSATAGRSLGTMLAACLGRQLLAADVSPLPRSV